MVVVAITLWLLPFGLDAAAAAPGDGQQRVLSNGLKIIVKEDHRAPTVAHMVWYRVGSIDEVNGRTGVAHVLEHMMFKGTKTMGAGEFSKRVAALGGRDNAFTNTDSTGYYEQIHASRLADMMALEADRMANLVFSKDEFAKEIKVVMEERRWRTEDRAQAIVHEQLMATALTTSPLRAPIIGWMSDLQSMTVEDAEQWYRDWYAPNNAVVVVAGDVEADNVFELAERYYGPIPSRPLPVRKPQEEPEQRGLRRLDVKAPAEVGYLLMAYRVPALRNLEADRDVYALELLSTLLDGFDGARLDRRLVRGRHLASETGASYDLTQRGPGLFFVDGVPAPGRTTVELEKALRAELAHIEQDGVSDAELARAKTQYAASLIYKRDSVFAQAMEAAELEIVGFSYRDADRLIEQIQQVTGDDVKTVVRKYLNEQSLTVATLLPQPVSGAVQSPAGAAR